MALRSVSRQLRRSVPFGPVKLTPSGNPPLELLPDMGSAQDCVTVELLTTIFGGRKYSAQAVLDRNAITSHAVTAVVVQCRGDGTPRQLRST